MKQLGFLLYILRGRAGVARCPHKSKVGGSNPPPARVVINQPPRGATWVTLMIENFGCVKLILQPKNL